MKVLAVVLGFALTGLAGAQEGEVPPPFVTTPEDVVMRMLRFAGVGPSDYVVDLGSGDGRIVIAAGRDFGARALGVELDPGLVEKSRANARAAGVADRASFVEGDVLRTDFSRATVVTVYLLPQLMDRLEPLFLERLEPGTRIVSHAFSMIGWRPDRIETMRNSTLYQWVVPANVRGTWQGGGWRLVISQNYQDLGVEASRDGRAIPGAIATLSGRAFSVRAPGFSLEGRLEGERIAGELEREGRRSPLVLQKAP